MVWDGQYFVVEVKPWSLLNSVFTSFYIFFTSRFSCFHVICVMFLGEDLWGSQQPNRFRAAWADLPQDFPAQQTKHFKTQCPNTVQYDHFNNETRKHSLDIFRFSLDLGHLARVASQVCVPLIELPMSWFDLMNTYNKYQQIVNKLKHRIIVTYNNW